MGKATMYLIFVAVGLLITTANLFFYINIGDANHSGDISRNKLSSLLQNPFAKQQQHNKQRGGRAGENKQRVAKKDEQPTTKPVVYTAMPSLNSTANVAVQHHNRHHSHQPLPPPTVATPVPAEEQRHHRHHHRGDSATTRPPSANSDDSPKPKQKKSSGKRLHKYVASELDRFHFVNYTFDEALEMYQTYLKEETEDIEQSSRNFRDIEEKSHAGIRLPTSESELLERFGVVESESEGQMPESPDEESVTFPPGTDLSSYSFCDPRNADYSAELDAACLRYLSNIQNMQSMKPMSSILSTGRTIKFKLFYKHHNVTAVVKVSQKKFALEPASEVIALKVDRFLGFMRVPPVAWVPIPTDFLRAASATMDAFYAKWFDKFVLHYDTAKSLTSKCYKDKSIQCLNVSIQLWMADVRNADETILKPSESFRKYLELPTPNASVEGTPVDTIRERLAPTSQVKYGNTTVTVANPKYIGLGELMDEFVFDLIIGNTDRWFGHNSFALGGCIGEAPCARTAAQDLASGRKPKSKSTMRLAFIDQGSSFYRKGAPEMNPFSTGFDSLCRFRKRTVEAVLNVIPEGLSIEEGAAKLYDAVRPQVPSGVFGIHNTALFRAGGSRLASLAQHMRSCIAKYGEGDTKYFSGGGLENGVSVSG